MIEEDWAQPHITQHKSFAFQAHPNFCFAKTSFMLGMLGESGHHKHVRYETHVQV